MQVDTAVGRWAQGRQGMQLPPNRPDGAPGDRYDTLVDNVRGPSIFVVPQSSQAYPAYVLTYGTPRRAAHRGLHPVSSVV